MPILEEWDLSGKSVVLATGSRGWGPTLASGLAEAGADIAVLGHRRDVLEECITSASRPGMQVHEFLVDLKDADAVKEVIKDVIGVFGKIDALVNDTQVEFAKPIVDITSDEYDAVMQRNVKSVFLTCQEVGRHMLEKQYGRIVNMCSTLAERSVANESVYCASMGAISQLTKAIGLEWAKSGITVNGIGTGWYSQDRIPLEEQQEDPLVRYLPSRRLGHPEDIVPLMVLLCSDASSYLNGQTIYVDGGAMTHA